MKLPEFEQLDVQVIACSTDSWFSHLAWLEQPKSEGGIQGVTYPILSDFNKTVSEAYGVLLPGGMALRGTFIIDKDGIVQAQVVNNLPLGRSIDETLRTVRALQFFETHGEVCPANWNTDKPSMKPTAEGMREYFQAQDQGG